jgi:phosphate transport system ATP-binding protein
MSDSTPKMQVERLTVRYDGRAALHGVSLAIPAHRVTAFVGPSGCGKSTLLRAMNRIHALSEGVTVEGRVLLDGVDIHAPEVDLSALRRRVGMVFQRATPFPMSVFDNVAFGLRLHGSLSRAALCARVEEALRQAALWHEVKDRLHAPADTLSGGQQQRLCIARALAVEPEVLLMDEPSSALDPVAAAAIEAFIVEHRRRYTFVVVTHSMQQARRIADRVAFFYLGHLVEQGEVSEVFEHPRDPRTQDFLRGRTG